MTDMLGYPSVITTPEMPLSNLLNLQTAQAKLHICQHIILRHAVVVLGSFQMWVGVTAAESAKKMQPHLQSRHRLSECMWHCEGIIEKRIAFVQDSIAHIVYFSTVWLHKHRVMQNCNAIFWIDLLAPQLTRLNRKWNHVLTNSVLRGTGGLLLNQLTNVTHQINSSWNYIKKGKIAANSPVWSLWLQCWCSVLKWCYADL